MKSYIVYTSLFSLALSGCYKPPYNNFEPYDSSKRAVIPATAGATAGTAAMAILAGPVLVGTVAGGAVGAAAGIYKNTKARLIKDLRKFDIKFIEYGDTVTFVVPTDRYYEFDTAHLNELCYPGLTTLMKVIKTYPKCCPIYVAGFTDAVGKRETKNKMSEARAETMLTYLWANGIQARRLNAEGYGDKFDVGDNKTVRGSAYNRRIEIQIFKDCSVQQKPDLANYVK